MPDRRSLRLAVMAVTTLVGYAIPLVPTLAAPPDGPDLAVTAVAASGWSAGGLGTYQATVTNLGTVPAAPVGLSHNLPGFLEVQSATGTDWVCIFSSHAVDCTVAEIGAGETFTVDVVVAVSDNNASQAVIDVGVDTAGDADNQNDRAQLRVDLGVIEEVPVDVPPAEEPPAEEPPADLPPSEVPPAEQPPVEELPAELPPVQPSDEPLAEEAPEEAPPVSDLPPQEPPTDQSRDLLLPSPDDQGPRETTESSPPQDPPVQQPPADDPGDPDAGYGNDDKQDEPADHDHGQGNDGEELAPPADEPPLSGDELPPAEAPPPSEGQPPVESPVEEAPTEPVPMENQPTEPDSAQPISPPEVTPALVTPPELPSLPDRVSPLPFEESIEVEVLVRPMNDLVLPFGATFSLDLAAPLSTPGATIALLADMLSLAGSRLLLPLGALGTMVAGSMLVGMESLGSRLHDLVKMLLGRT